MPGIDECLLEAMSLPGARGAWLVDWTSGLALGAAGESPVGDHETTAAEAAELARAAAEYDSFAGTAPPPRPVADPVVPPGPPTADPVPPPRPITGPVPPAPTRPPLTPPASQAPTAGAAVPAQGTGPAAGGPSASRTGSRAASRTAARPSTEIALRPGTEVVLRERVPKGPPVEDLIVTTRGGYHVLRFVETSFDSSVFLHLWLDRDTGNLALARMRLRDLAEKLVLG